MTALDLDVASFEDGDNVFDVADVTWVFSRVDNFVDELPPDQREYARGLPEVRANEFSSGRRSARAALTHLGCAEPTVAREGRRPVFPTGFVGSIGHTRKMATACCGPSTTYHGIGCDIERCDRAMSDRVTRRITVDVEASSVSALDHGQTLVFAAKEAIYKAVNPITDEYFDFLDVVLSVDLGNQSFSGKCVGPRRSAPVIDSGRGAFGRYRDHWVALFLIAR